jgi:hypothetical protein
MSLEECFKQVEDPRKASGLRFPLPALLSMMVMSYMSGNTGYRASAKFMEGNREEFTQMYGLKHGTPGHTQINTIHKLLDFEQINQAFFKWINSFVAIEAGEWLHGDGKSLKSTVKDSHSSEQDFELMVRLFAQKLGIVIQSGRTRNKSGEGPALQQLLQQLEHKGVIVTLDALHCQKKL